MGNRLLCLGDTHTEGKAGQALHDEGTAMVLDLPCGIFLTGSTAKTSAN